MRVVRGIRSICSALGGNTCERKGVREKRGDSMRSKSCAEVLSKGVSCPVIGAIAVSCEEFALRCDITILESLEKGCMPLGLGLAE